MKKLLSISIALLLSLGLVACSSNNDGGSNDKKSEDVAPVTRDLKEDDYEVKGDGDFLIVCAGGNTENGNVPVEYVDSDTSLSQIGYESRNFDGSKLSFIYVNGMLQDKQQLSDSQNSLELKDDLLKPGTYKVEVVQYDNDDPSGEMLTYKTCEYEIKQP